MFRTPNINSLETIDLCDLIYLHMFVLCKLLSRYLNTTQTLINCFIIRKYIFVEIVLSLKEFSISVIFFLYQTGH